MPPEWFGLNFNSALLTKFYWNYATYTVRVCNSPFGPINPQLHISKKFNLQVKFGSKSMNSLCDLLCYLPFTTTDPLLEESLSYLPTGFHSHIFDYIDYEHPRMMNQSILLTHQFLHFIPMIRLTFLKYLLLYIAYLLCNSKILPQRRAKYSKKGRLWLKDPRRPAEEPQYSILRTNSQSWQATLAVPAFPQTSRRGTAGTTAAD